MRNFQKIPCKFYLVGEARCISLIYLVNLLNDCGWLFIIVLNYLCHMALTANNVLCSCYWSCQFMVYSYPLFIAVAFIIPWCIQVINNKGDDQKTVGVHGSLEYCAHYVYTTLERLKCTPRTVSYITSTYIVESCLKSTKVT